MPGEEILADIDLTLDQLIKNTEAMNNVQYQKLTKEEIEAFQKTQESLLAHLIYIDEMLETKQKEIRIPSEKSANYKIQEKLLKFEKMHCVQNISKSFGMDQLKSKKAKVRKKAKSFVFLNKTSIRR